MSMESLGGAGRTASNAPITQSPSQESQNEGVHAQRSVVPTESKRVLPELTETEGRHFLPLSHRNDTVGPYERVRSGGFVDFVTSLVMPSVVRGLNSTPRKELKKLRTKARSITARFRHDQKQLRSAERELAKIETRLNKLRTKFDRLTGKEQRAMVRLVQKKAELIPKFAELEAVVKHYETESEELRGIEAKLLHQREKTGTLLGSALKSGIRFLTGMQTVYAAKNDPANRDTIYQLDLGNMTLTDEGHYEVQLKGIKLLIDKCHMDGENFVISVTECSARCSSQGVQPGSDEPVELTGKCTLTFKPPLAREMQSIMTTPAYRLPGTIKQRWKAFRAGYFSSDSTGNKPKLLDFVDFNLDGVSRKVGNGYFDLLNQSGGELLLKLMTPVIGSAKQYSDEAVLSELRYKKACLTKEAHREDKLCRMLTDFQSELKSDLAALPKPLSREQSELQELHSGLQKQIDDAVEKEVQFQNAKSVEQDQLDVAESIARGRDSWIEGFDNMIKAVSSMRKAMLHATPDRPVPVAINPQKIRLGLSGYVDIDNLEMQVSDVEMRDDGVLTITAPTALAKMTVGHELKEPNSADMSLEGLKLTLDPPLGPLAWEMLNLQFPINARHFDSLRKKYEELTHIHKAEGTGVERATLKDLIHFQLDKVTSAGEPSAGGKEPSAGGNEPAATSEPDTARLAGEISALAGVDVDGNGLQHFLGEYVTMSDGSKREVKNLLSMAILGLGHVASASPQGSGSIRRVASRINKPNRQRPAEWKAVQPEPKSTDEKLPEPELLGSVSENGSVKEPVMVREHDEKDDEGDGEEQFLDALSEPYDPAKDEALDTASVTPEPVARTTEAVVAEPAPEVVEQKQVQELIGKKSFYVDGDSGKEAVYEAHTDLQSLVGQLKGFVGWLVGKDTRDVLTVTSLVGESGAVLVNPKIQSKKGNIFRRYFVNRMLKKALKERSIKTVVGLSKDHLSLELRPWQPVVPPPDVNAN